MSKITRKTQQIFGSTAGANQIEQFGSLAAGSPVYTTDPATIQALANYLTGWFGGVVGANLPAIEDLNALCYLFAYQLAYGFQAGVPEWDSATTYFIGSIVNDGTGFLYKSLTDNNLNNAVTSSTNWILIGGSGNKTVPISSSPRTLLTADNGSVFLVDTTNFTQFNLPTPVPGYRFTVVDATGNCNKSLIGIHPTVGENVQGLAATLFLQANFGRWTFESDGTNWYIVG